jgi:hypothetical protein
VISLGAKYADYGLTGGFAICGQAALLFWLAPERAHSIIAGAPHVLGTYLGQLPEGLVTPISAVITAVAIISIFFLGLVLELIGSVAAFWELRVFKEHLEYNRPWLSSLLSDYGAAPDKDIESIVSGFGKLRSRLKLLKPFSRVESLLLSYVLAADSAPRLDLLRDHLQLCRISRAVSAVLYIFGFELVLIPCVQVFLGYAPSGFSILLILLGVGFGPLALFLPKRAYERFCSNLFSIVLILSRKLDKKSCVSPGEPAGTLTQETDNG